MTTRNASLVGAGLALAVFLAVGLLPALLYGGYAGLLLGVGICGTSACMVARALTVFGAVLGVTAVASLFTVAGAVTGAIVHAAIRVGSKTSISRFTRRA